MRLGGILMWRSRNLHHKENVILSRVCRVFCGKRSRRICPENNRLLPPRCHPEERSDEGSAVGFSWFRVGHHSIPHCGCFSTNSGFTTLALVNRLRLRPSLRSVWSE